MKKQAKMTVYDKDNSDFGNKTCKTLAHYELFTAGIFKLLLVYYGLLLEVLAKPGFRETAPGRFISENIDNLCFPQSPH